MITLDDHERKRFFAWLEQEADSHRTMLRQLETMPGMEPVIKKFRVEVAAYIVVARQLYNTETQTIGE